MDFEQNIVHQVLGLSASKKIFYKNDPLYEDTVLDIPKDAELVILNHCYANNHTLQQYNLLKDKVLNKDFALLTSNYWYYKNKHENIIYFPYYYFHFLTLPLQKFDIQNTRPYSLMCFNLNPWLHRTVNLLAMSKKKWFNDCKLSFHWGYNLPHYNTTNIITDTLTRLSDEQRLELSQFNLPIIIEDDWDCNGNFYVPNTSHFYSSTYINYVTENSCHQEFITEKTWKPIFSGQLFYVLGSLNIIEHLRDLGLDVFDDIFNHSYDYENDIPTKIDLILADLDRVMEMDLDRVWQETSLRRKRNLDLVYSQDFKNMLANDLIKKVS